MYVNVMFRDVYKKEFTNGPYTYKCNLIGVEVGRLVLCNTRYGISLAQVHKMPVVLKNPADADKLQEIVELCHTTYDLPEVKNAKN